MSNKSVAYTYIQVYILISICIQFDDLINCIWCINSYFLFSLFYNMLIPGNIYTVHSWIIFNYKHNMHKSTHDRPLTGVHLPDHGSRRSGARVSLSTCTGSTHRRAGWGWGLRMYSTSLRGSYTELYIKCGIYINYKCYNKAYTTTTDN